MEKLNHLKIPFEEIKLATNDFGDENFLGRGGFGAVYKGELSHCERHIKVAVKRLDIKGGQGRREFLTEIIMLSSYKHKNLASLVGFCDEGVEKILVYELETHGSLDGYLSCMDLTWMQRLKICLGVARGLNYLHGGVGVEHRVIHRDIKSSNVLLDDNWEAKISDFGLSKIGPANLQFTFLVSNACGTLGYVDPQYQNTGILTKESDVYSFGVLLFEVLCGRPACVPTYQDERRFLAGLAKSRYVEDRLDEIINPVLREQMNEDTLNTFSMIAYKCLIENRSERPRTDQIVEELEKALEHQLATEGPNAQLAHHLHHGLEAVTAQEMAGGNVGPMAMAVTDTIRGSLLQKAKRRKDKADRQTIRVPAPRLGNSEIPPEDGYIWRKYGQKEILGSRFPRAYYRCRNGLNCQAIKQVQRLDDDIYTFEVTYLGVHTCNMSTISMSGRDFITPFSEVTYTDERHEEIEREWRPATGTR